LLLSEQGPLFSGDDDQNSREVHMNTPNYPPQPPSGPYGNPQQRGPYGQPQGGPPQYGPPGGGPRPQQPPPPPSGQPYGGPPPGGQGFGQPPPPPPSGPPPPGQPPASYPTPPAPDPAARPSSSGKVIKIVGALVVIGIVVAAVIYFQGKSASSAEVGDCIKVTNVDNSEVEKVDCNSNDATYKVAVTEDSSTATCPDGDYMSYTESGSGDLTICMTLNGKVGDCFNERTKDHLRVDCSSPDATFKILELLDGQTDIEACADPATGGYVYSEPELTICAAEPNAA
jgi:hypothetical protein